MSRCRKLYAAIGQLTTIFKIVAMRQKLKKSIEFTHDKLQSLNQRLLAAIKVFLGENRIFPSRFVFEKRNLLISIY